MCAATAARSAGQPCETVARRPVNHSIPYSMDALSCRACGTNFAQGDEAGGASGAGSSGSNDDTLALQPRQLPECGHVVCTACIAHSLLQVLKDHELASRPTSRDGRSDVTLSEAGNAVCNAWRSGRRWRQRHWVMGGGTMAGRRCCEFRVRCLFQSGRPWSITAPPDSRTDFSDSWCMKSEWRCG